ncbi:MULTISPECIES: vWA domain-containing protein [Hyphobacterium]|uniref:VWA domain-containing protein n=1 Tax=Hyphobacterium vulgare TaxID=1736751 RepID=A0ABV6ZWE3_9PROT
MRIVWLAGVTAGLLASASFAQTEIVAVDHGVDACPAFDVIQARILEVTRGTLAAGSETVAPEGEGPIAVEFILDASGSMGAQAAGREKMQIALDAFEAALSELQGANVLAGLRAYGFDSSLAHTAEASCPNSELLTGFRTGDEIAALGTAARGLTPYGYTPIAASLRAAADDLIEVEARERLIVLISDGEETCNGDPVAVAGELAGLGVNLSTYVVGFDLDAAQAAQMRAIAQAGGGRYLDAPDGDALANAMREAVGMTVRRSERRLERCSNPIEGGLTPEDAVLIEPGIYTVGELLPRGEYRYFRVATDEGDLGVVRGLLQSYAYVGEADNLSESPAALGAMTIRMLNPEGERAGSGFPRIRNLPGEATAGYYADTDGRGFVFAIGDNYETVTPESLFEVAIEDGDDGEGGDNDAEVAGNYSSLGSNASARGHVGHDDLSDLWAIHADGPLSVTVTLENADMRFTVEIVDPDTGRRIDRPRFTGSEVSVDLGGPGLVRVATAEPRLASKHSAYTISVSAR